MMQVGSNPALAKELLGADVNEGNFIKRMTAVKERRSEPWQIYAHNGTITMKDVKAMNKKQLVEEYEYICRRLEKDRLLSAQYNLFRPKPAINEPPSKRQRVEPAMDSAGSRHEIGVSPFADSAASSSPSNVSIDHIPIDVLFESTSGGILEFFLESDEEERIGMSRVVADPDSDDEVFAEIIFRGKSISGDGVVFVDKLPDDEIVDIRVKANRRQKSFINLKQLLPHVYREDLLLLRRRMNRYFRLNPEVDVGLELWRDVNMLCQTSICNDVEDFWRTQDEWIVSSWQLYPKSSVHVLDLTNGKTVYMFVDKVYPIRATLLERMLRHRLTVPPSYCRDVVVAGNIIQTVQAGLRQAYECIASAPIACTARQMVFSSPWLTAKKESGSPLQTALVFVTSNPLIAVKTCQIRCMAVTVCQKNVRVSKFTLEFNVLRIGTGFVTTAGVCFHQNCVLYVAIHLIFAVHRSHAVSFDAAVLDVAATVSAACIIAAGYIVFAGIYDAAGSSVLAVFINIC
ncbi:hypothetical protein Tco_0508745 [Tanacetum coccineum]